MLFHETAMDHPHIMDGWFNIFGVYYWIFMITFWSIYIGSSIIFAYFVHKDAIKRNITNSEFWLVIALIFNIVGVILYLLVRPNYSLVEN
ncbi:MAG: hypothetical protein GF353_04670 [Candidatus Lokiarchaeota archaeon]|nr:hypothetical protein [Candidatus Lokiarchaeota archaeon]